ncbi:MAG: TatD family hydrolase [Sphaerochaetaceae bacterium]|nr:TatD family hydrolase [Sphaerochaetaceae bacterium]
MTDFHNHFTDRDSILCPSDLLPQYYTREKWESIKKLKPAHLGEAGLDRRFPDLEEQKKKLLEILEFAKENRLLVTLHCVRCTGAMLEILKAVKPNEKSVIWHGFTGSAETASELYRLSVIVSIGPRLPRERIREVAESNPYFVFETDYEGNSEEEHKKIITDVYNSASEELGLTVDRLEELSCDTAKAFKTAASARS